MHRWKVLKGLKGVTVENSWRHQPCISCRIVTVSRANATVSMAAYTLSGALASQCKITGILRGSPRRRNAHGNGSSEPIICQYQTTSQTWCVARVAPVGWAALLHKVKGQGAGLDIARLVHTTHGAAKLRWGRRLVCVPKLFLQILVRKHL